MRNPRRSRTQGTDWSKPRLPGPVILLESRGLRACGLRHRRPFLLDSREDLMSATTMVPVTISSEARSFLDRLGQAEDLEKMIDRARHVVTGLLSIDIVLDEATEEMPSGVVLWAHRDDIGPES